MFVFRTLSFALLAGLAWAPILVASAVASCVEAEDPDDTGIVILRCAGVLIAAEATAVRSSPASMDAHPHAIQLDAGAIAISLEAQPVAFAALAPEAVFYGRDADWAVIADPGRTRARVWRGNVTARLRTDGVESVLSAGDDERDALEQQRTQRLNGALRRAKARP